MDAQATDGPSRGPVSAEGENGEKNQNIVLGTADAGQHSLTAPGVSAQAPARRQDASLTQDGQLAEAGYGHGV